MQNLSLSINGKPNGSYEYRILACSPYSKTQPLLCSAVSAPVAVQVAIPGGIVAPKNFNLGLNSQTYVGGNYSFEWSAVSAATSYKVCEYDTAGGAATQCKTVNGLSSVSQPYGHGLNEVLITFYYDVKACTASVCSVGSTPQYSVQITCPPSTPNCLPPRPNSTKEAGVISYIHTDQLGSPVAETNAAGALTTRFRYEPFGQSLESNPVQGPGYTGHVADAASGLIYMQQRYYDPVIGRFLSTDPDPVGELGLNFNRYAYVGNNPYKYVDPDGRCFEDACIGEAILVGMLVGGGIDATAQKIANPSEPINIQSVAISAAVGGVTGGSGAVLTSGVAAGSLTVGQAVVRQAGVSAATGAAGAAAGDLASGNTPTGAGMLKGAAVGAATSVIGSAATGVTGGFTQAAGSGIAARMSSAAPNTPAGIGAAIVSTTRSAGVSSNSASAFQATASQLPKITDLASSVAEKKSNQK